MKEMKEDAGIEAPRITPYSARKRLIQKLSDDGVPANQIVQISGHKNVNSLNNYSKLNNAQCKNISNILSDRPSTSYQSVAPCNSALDTNTPPTTFNGKSEGAASRGFFINSHFHGNVTFNFHSSTTSTQKLSQQVINPSTESEVCSADSSPLHPKKYQRIRMISDSDSD
ncbi:uncharacterized protein LOC132752466 [Ruditapes philippinarum]|uniref:uncharacterized protein LOC132752466 n=1 Tax=Ruditapes philippinarum TaxID=129788 RepID=UPI00295B05A7|nr:uncharacterized protein LOC132752466 [Ruditapes philippinarum]